MKIEPATGEQTIKRERRKNVKKVEDRCRERKGEDIKKERERKKDIKR